MNRDRMAPSPTREGPRRNLHRHWRHPCLCHLEAVILGLLKTPARYDASEPKASMKGLGVGEDSLTEIICSSTNQELQEINRVYEEMYKTSLKQDILSNTPGGFHKLMVALTKGWRAENGSAVDYELFDQDTCYLHDAGVKRKDTFPSVLASWLSGACVTSWKYLKGTRATALMTCWRASRRRSKVTWKMISWTWSSAFGTSPCILLTDCTSPWMARALVLRFWLESPAVTWTCWK